MSVVDVKLNLLRNLYVYLFLLKWQKDVFVSLTII